MRQVLSSTPDPGGPPPNSLFVPVGGSSVGACVQTCLPPWSQLHSAPPPLAICGGRHSGFHHCLRCVHLREVPAPTTCRSSLSTANSLVPVVAHHSGFYSHLLVQHVFRILGFPKDIVSNRGPQFTSRVWRAFCTTFGAEVNLSSSYHPQSNEQMEEQTRLWKTHVMCGSPTPVCLEFPSSSFHRVLPQHTGFMSLG